MNYFIDVVRITRSKVASPQYKFIYRKKKKERKKERKEDKK